MSGTAPSAPQQVSVLLYSDNIEVRDSVRAAVGRRPARDVEVVQWHECATGEAVIEAIDEGGFDLAPYPALRPWITHVETALGIGPYV